MRDRPAFIHPTDDKFPAAVADVVSRYDFSLVRNRCLIDAIGRYVEMCVIMAQKADPTDTREVYLQRQLDDETDGWRWYALNIHMPYYAEHKAAVYAEACRVALHIDGVRFSAPEGTGASRLAHDRLLKVHTLDLCPHCHEGYLVQFQVYSETEGLSWAEECGKCNHYRIQEGL